MADGRSCDEVDRGWLDDNYRSCACTSQGKGRIGAGVGDFFWGGVPECIIEEERGGRLSIRDRAFARRRSDKPMRGLACR
jgi:hypothetical protein